MGRHQAMASSVDDENTVELIEQSFPVADERLHALQIPGRATFGLQVLDHTQQHGALRKDAFGVSAQCLCQIEAVGIDLIQGALARRPDLPNGGARH